MRFRDAHNHLQDERFGGRQDELLAVAAQAGVGRMVVNGACEADWPQVADLARRHAIVLPSFGYHPWYIHERTSEWQRTLTRHLDETPGAVIGEAGLDRWKPDLSYDGQEEVFTWQLRLAAERNAALSIHCLQAWGRLFDILRVEPRPQRGFLLHSYGGPQEMVLPLAKLGAYFSFPGFFAHERKVRQREAFKQVPAERLLIETDAPDQLLPKEWERFSLVDAATGKPLNHPANLAAVYEFVAGMLGEPLEALAGRVEENFQRLFEAK
jgi:TatD DNase family protein